jgi:alpha/beta superfamily hydrolase
MVTKGQFLERPTLVPVAKDVLEGLWHRGNRTPPLLVIPPPPGDGSMDHVVAAEVAWAASTAGHATLRFNHRGVGASQGKGGDLEARIADAGAALQVLLENTSASSAAVLAIGGSAETALTLRDRNSAVAGVACVSPDGLDLRRLARFPPPLLCVVGELEARYPRPQLSAALSEAGGDFEVIEAADASYLRNLPQVGKVVVEWLRKY